MANEITTSEEREQAFILLFEKSFNDDIEPERIIELASECDTVNLTSYSQKLFLETCNKLPVIDEFISKYLKGWSMQRLSKVSLAVLRLAICEMRYFDKIPVGTSINDAVNICKKYASDDEYTFVNGILGSFAREEVK